MEHRNLTLEHDNNLIEKILDDLDNRYILLFLYIIRNDLLKDFNDLKLMESYEKVLRLDDVYKSNILDFWDEEFIEIYIDLGLIKNIRSLREFEKKPDDFILKLGEETVTIENNKISVPDDTLFIMINKKFKSITRRNFNLALTRLKGVRCEKSNNIHSLIFEIGEHDYVLSDDIYYILDQFGNIYQSIKIELTIDGFHQRLIEMKEKINGFIKIFEPVLNTKPVFKKIKTAIEENKDVIRFLKESKVELSEKFNYEKINKDDEIFKQWNIQLLSLVGLKIKINQVELKLIELIKYYSGKKKKFSYLEFIEKVSYNEDEIVNIIQKTLINLRKDLVKVIEVTKKLTSKELKLLNLDYERSIIESSDE